MALPSSPSRDGDDSSVSPLSRGQLIDVLKDTVGDLERLDLGLEVRGVEEHRRLRDRLIAEVRDHVLPRLEDVDVPAVVVVGGSTGAGKSTLVNSVLGAEISDAGVLRPTTRTPVLVVNPEDAEAFAEHPVASVCRTVVRPEVPAGIALIDASDLDSVQDSNRVLAQRLLEAADLWLFVTTAARYGDLTPWATLEDAAGRGTPVGIVLNRVPDRILSEVRRDLVSRLEGLGLAEAPFFVVPDAGPHEGLLPASSAAELRDWLEALAGRHRAAGLVRRTGRSQWAALRQDLRDLAEGVDAQADGAARLEERTVALAEVPLGDLASEIDRGACAEGAPETRWLTLASTGGPLAALAQGGRLRRGFLGRAERARAAALAELAEECRSALAARLEAAVVGLADDVRRLWSESGASTHASSLLTVAPGASDVVAAWAGGPATTGGPAVPGLPAESVADLVVAAVTGVAGARSAATRLGLEETVTASGAALSEAVAGALHAAAPAGAALELVPDPGLAAALRLRAGELTPLTPPGA